MLSGCAPAPRPLAPGSRAIPEFGLRNKQFSTASSRSARGVPWRRLHSVVLGSQQSHASLRRRIPTSSPREHARRRCAYVKDCHTDLILTVLRSVDSDCLNDDSNLPRSARFFASRAAQAASRTSPGLLVTSAAAPVNCVVTISILSRRRRQRQSVADPEQWGYPASTSPAVPITSARVSFQCRAAVVKLTDCCQRPSDQTGNHPSPGTTHTHTRAVRLDLPC